MTNLLVSNLFTSSTSSHRVHPLKSSFKNPHSYRLDQLLTSVFNNETLNNISKPISTTMSLIIPFTSKNNCGNLNTLKNVSNITKKYSCSRAMGPERSYQDVLMLADNADQYSLVGLKRDNMPKHVAIILDGSRRWLKAHGKPLSYAPFFEANMLFADLCIKWRVATATTFVYSLKNLGRGKEANDLLFGELERFLKNNARQFNRKGIRVIVIGERLLLPQTLQNIIGEVEEATKDCTKLELMLAVCYAGTRDIVNATKSICEKVSAGEIELKAIDEALLENELATGVSRVPHADLVIRTGGRLRVSDYVMWGLAQAELYFTNISSLEFSELEFVQALRFFQSTERNFGK